MELMSGQVMPRVRKIIAEGTKVAAE
jgi:hypothetical protein